MRSACKIPDINLAGEVSGYTVDGQITARLFPKPTAEGVTTKAKLLDLSDAVARLISDNE